MSLPWNYFIRRRGTTPRQYIKKNGIATYSELCKNLARHCLVPPEKEEVSEYFAEVKRKPARPPGKLKTLGIKSPAKEAPTEAKKPEPTTEKPKILSAPPRKKRATRKVTKSLPAGSESETS